MNSRKSRILTVALAMSATCLTGCAVSEEPADVRPAARASTAGEEKSPAKAEQPDPSELLRNGKEPFTGILVGGQPTREQLSRMKELGYRTIVNMRVDGEEGSTDPAYVEELGMKYVHLPIAGSNGVTDENARLLDTILKESEHPVVVHCASGNRVGALFGLKAHLVDGKSADESLAIARAAGITRLEPFLKEKLEE